jgi:hypothetical protein
MTQRFLRAAGVGVVLSFVVVPTLLLLNLVIGAEPHAPIGPNLVTFYVLYGAVSVVIFLVFGLPTLTLLRRLRWRSWWAFAIGGAVVALVGEASLVFGGVGYWDTSNLLSMLNNTVVLGLAGGVTGGIFWFFAIDKLQASD